jgi:hypothetical protein
VFSNTIKNRGGQKDRHKASDRPFPFASLRFTLGRERQQPVERQEPGFNSSAFWLADFKQFQACLTYPETIPVVGNKSLHCLTLIPKGKPRMKTSTKLLMLLSLLCLISPAVSAQPKTRKKRSTTSTICRVESVPNGMVIVGYKTNPAVGKRWRSWSSGRGIRNSLR